LGGGGGGNVTSIFCIPSKPYTFSVAFSREDPAADSEHSAEKIQQQIPNIQQKIQQQIQQQIPNIQQKIQTDLAAATDSKHSAEDPAADLAADAATIKDSLFRPHFSQPSKEDYEQNFAATRAQLSSIFERVS
jgi:hypothetical protein